MLYWICKVMLSNIYQIITRNKPSHTLFSLQVCTLFHQYFYLRAHVSFQYKKNVKYSQSFPCFRTRSIDSEFMEHEGNHSIDIRKIIFSKLIISTSYWIESTDRCFRYHWIDVSSLSFWWASSTTCLTFCQAKSRTERYPAVRNAIALSAWYDIALLAWFLCNLMELWEQFPGDRREH